MINHSICILVLCQFLISCNNLSTDNCAKSVMVTYAALDSAYSEEILTLSSMGYRYATIEHLHNVSTIQDHRDCSNRFSESFTQLQLVSDSLASALADYDISPPELRDSIQPHINRHLHSIDRLEAICYAQTQINQ